MARNLSKAFKIYLIAFLLSLTVIQGVSPSLVVRADDEDTEEEETTDDSSEGAKYSENVIDRVGADGDGYGRILGAIKYNEQLQYIMTYTILMNDYMSTKGYSDIYLNGTGATGYNSNGVNTTIKTGNQNMLISSESGDDKHHQEGGGDDGKAERQKAVDALVKELTDYFVNMYIEKYYLSPKELPFANNGKLVKIEPNIKSRGSKSAKTTHFNGFRENGGTYALIRKEIEKKIRTQVEKQTTHITMEIDSIIPASVAKEYQKEYKDYTMVSKQVMDYTAGIAYLKNEYHFGAKGRTEEENRRIARFVPYRGGKYSATNGGYMDNTSGVNYDAVFTKEKFEAHAAYMEKLYKSDVFKNYAKAMEGYQGDIESGKENIKNEDISSLGWLPLDIRIPDKLREDKVKWNEKTYGELIEMYDGGRITSSGRVEFEKKNEGYSGNRALQINDIVNLPVNNDGDKKKSASPYLTYNYGEYRNRDIGSAYITTSTTKLKDGMSRYSGMKVEKIQGSWTDIFKPKNKTGVAEALTTADIVDDGDKLYPHKIISAMATDVKNIGNNVGKSSDFVLGIDNYGNIISGSTLSVVVPYWQNTEIEQYKDFNTKEGYYLSTPIVNNNNIPEIVSKAYVAGASKGYAREANADLDKLGDWVTGKNNFRPFLDNVPAYTKGITKLKEGIDGNKEMNTQALALAIVAGTKDKVAAYNEQFVGLVDKHKELYVEPSDAGRGSSGGNGESDLDKYTAADLLERIMMILDIGFYELIRLTIVSWVVSFYTATVSNFALSSVFHTSLITESALWTELIGTVSLLLIGFMGLYILFMAFKMFRGTLAWKDFVKQFVGVTLILIIPTVVYTPLVNYTINKPTQMIVGKQMEQMSLLDAYLNREYEKKLHDANYRRLFGSVESLRDRSEDYLIDFYTTRHVEGFDVTNVTYEELSFKNQFRNMEMVETGKWRKNDLIRVKVSIFDLFKWVESGSDTPLFQWLETEFSGDGKYVDVGKYEEFKTSTAVNYPSLGVAIEGEEWTASELYKRMYLDTNNDAVMENISGLFKVTHVFRNREKDVEMGKVTDHMKEGLIRDLAMTADSRNTVYGDGRTGSPNTMELLGRYGGGVGIPENDFLALENIVNKLVPYRDSTTTTLDEDVYNINKKVIDNYISNYSIVRETVGDNDSNYRYSEFHMIVMDMWFEVNKALDLAMFPRSYEVASMSFDSYMRLAYIPMEAFSNVEDKDLDNVSQYLALREHPATLLFGFLPALVMLVAFGMIYVAVFYVLMMVLMTASFIRTQILRIRKSKTDDKAWLGTIVIILTMALAKIGLLLIWKAMSYILNYTVVMKGGTTYPYGFIHSLIIVVYLFIVIRVIFTRLLKAVWKDKGNLGGAIFQKTAEDLYNKGKARVRGLSSMPDKAVSKAGASITKVLGEEGLKGTVKTAAGGFASGALKEMAGRVKGSKSDVNAIGEALKATGEVATGQQIKSRFGGVVQGLMGKVGLGVMDKYDKIGEGSVGLTAEEQENMEKSGAFGTVLASTADGSNVTSMETGSVEGANKLATHLQEQGLQAVANGTEVVFNSTGVNLAEAKVRKGLYGGLMENLFEDVEKSSKVVEEDVEGAYNYTEGSKGNIVLGVGKGGIGTGSVDAILASDTFKENFVVTSKPVKTSEGYLQGSMKITPIRENVNVAEAMEKLFTVDSKVREVQGAGSRETLSTTSSLQLDSAELKKTRKYLSEGMMIQGDKVIYDSDNEEHVASANKIRERVRKVRDKKQKDSVNMMMRLASHVSNGGNSGFSTVTENTSQNEDLRAMAYQTGLVSDTVTTQVFGGSKTEEVVKNLTQMRNLLNTSPEVQDKYARSKDGLQIEGEEVLIKRTKNNPDKLLHALSSYAEKEKVTDSMSTKIMDEYKALGEQRRKSNISEQDYNNEVMGLYADMQMHLQDKGKYDQFMASTIREEVKAIGNNAGKGNKGKKGRKQKEMKEKYSKILKEYTDSRVELKESGVDVDTIETFSRQDFDRLGQLVGDIDTVEATKDGKINVQSYSGLDEKEVGELVNAMTTEKLEKE